MSGSSSAPITLNVTPEQLRILQWGVALQRMSRTRADVDPEQIVLLLHLLHRADPAPRPTPPPRQARRPK